MLERAILEMDDDVSWSWDERVHMLIEDDGQIRDTGWSVRAFLLPLQLLVTSMKLHIKKTTLIKTTKQVK